MNSGSYQLRIRIARRISVEIGALGVCVFEPGDYIYTGSAMRNLAQRVARHRRSEKKLRWHIDYLLAHPGVDLIETFTYPSARRDECELNQTLVDAGAEIPLPRFGSTDCRRCASHLLKIRN
ncbi:MAG: GIY-YIG nuclease family protein [Acidobacteria bacterium]|nr:GIY-YIG nuclease family protein [Acidobacteriota bacterium]MBK8148455.1 GIY-YIG nuclease family protein [Acidobacteriota bacterium]